MAARAALFILLSAPAQAAAESVVVEPGDNLEAAFRQLEPGDELAFGGGTFTLVNGLDASLDGTVNGRITIRGSDSTIIEGPDRDFTMRLEGTYFTIQNLDVRGPGDALVLSGEEIVVSNSTFVGASRGILCEDCVGTTIIGCEFRAMTDEDGAAFFSEAFANGTLAGNWVHDGMGAGFVLGGRTANTSINDNVIEALGGNGIEVEFPASLTGAEPNSVIGNFVGDVGGHGIVTRGGAFVTTNIVTAFGGDGIQSTVDETMGELDVLLTHNTVVGETTCFRASQWSLSTSNNVVANNAFYCPDDVAFIFDDGVGMNTLVVNNIFVGAADFPGDSLAGNGLEDFLDADTGNFYPSEDSALIDAANPAYLTNLDYNGVQRDSTPEAGAYERTGNTNPGGVPGGAFKLEGPPQTGDDMGNGGGGDGGGGGGGPSGGAMGGASGFPERDGCAGCTSAGTGGALLPGLLLLGLFAVRRRR